MVIKTQNLVNMSMRVVNNISHNLVSFMQPNRRFNIEIIKKPTILGSVNHLYLTNKLYLNYIN